MHGNWAGVYQGVGECDAIGQREAGAALGFVKAEADDVHSLINLVVADTVVVAVVDGGLAEQYLGFSEDTTIPSPKFYLT